ncbi:MAG: hypothetical protein C0502_08920 [Opitutus sp.]|nr:hypothetical protein [Opitutus sp.]
MARRSRHTSEFVVRNPRMPPFPRMFIQLPSLARFIFLRYPLLPFDSIAPDPGAVRSGEFAQHLARSRYSIRLLRYWWAGQAIAAEARRQRRPLVVVDLGCERGWLKHFTPTGSVSRWIGLDWKPNREASDLLRYDQVLQANFDETLPVEAGSADAVVSLHVFEHLPRPGATMAEVARILKPGGIFLGGAPTMPDWLARLRVGYFRRQQRQGLIAPGGHITVLSPDCWKSLAANTGLEVEHATGSHLMRMTGSRCENWKWWIRCNQVWGALFPSLGSECCLQARRAQTKQNFAPLSGQDRHWRPAWLALGGAMACMLLVMSVALGFTLHDSRRQRLADWIAAHQDGDEFFIVPSRYKLWTKKLGQEVSHAADLSQMLALAERSPHAHVLVRLDEAVSILQQQPERWCIDSRNEWFGRDYLLLRQMNGMQGGTPLAEYLAMEK